MNKTQFLTLDKNFVESYKDKTPNWGFNGLGYIVYKRTYSRVKENGENEEWFETVERCVNGAQKIGAKYTNKEMERLYDLVFNLKCNFAGRMLWQLGTSTVDRFGANSLLNCWNTAIKKPEDFCFVFENLMLGGGVGFSVRREDVHELPKVKKNVKVTHELTKDADFIVPDSRGGWIALLRNVLDSYFISGKSFSYSTILVRGAGEPIAGFGGTASGPLILVEGMEKICNVLKSREGKKMRSVDALDICNIIGSVVVAGNVRRSAEIALGDPDDILFLRAKRWDLGNIPNWRAMSNNTIYADDYNHVMEEVWDGYKGNGEPYGFFNLPLSQKYGRLKDGKLGKDHPFFQKEDDCIGTNPCQNASAPILTKEGISTFGKLKEGDEIWSESGWTKVIKKWSNGVKKVFRFGTTGGVFYGTENHRLVSHGQKIEAQYAETVDILSGPFESNIEINKQDVIDGLVFGDGSVHAASNNLVYLCVGQDDKDYLNSEIKEFITEYRPGLSPYAYEVKTDITHQELVKTYLRSVPDRYFYGNKVKVASFLRGLYTANGSFVGGRITLKAASFKVIEQVQLMLSSLGISSYYTTNKSKSVQFSNGEYTCRQSYDLNITSDREKFISIIGFIQDYKTEKVIDFISKTRSNSRKKVSYDIVSVDFLSEEEVFDITVNNETHTYWTGGVNVSNCGEISLSDKECCNLAELYLNNIDSQEELNECAKLIYKTQKAIAALPFIHDETNKIVHKNMRLGLGVTGICQSLNKIEWLDKCYEYLRGVDKEWSSENDYPVSIKLTTCKPSGTLSLLGGSTPGVHPGFSKYYIRRVRMSSNDRLVQYCRDLGFHVEFAINYDKSTDHGTVVVEFPCASGSDAIITSEMSAIKQLEIVKKLQNIWSDNAVSVTVYYKPEELAEIQGWMKENYGNSLKSVSFLLHSDHGFCQAPYQEITEKEYIEIKKKVKPIKAMSFNSSGKALEGVECSSGSCPIR